ncbi:YpoC family protein [Listeria sp. PSOL-1]|uniref:YpoC family protein n=1 Tax=Listeria sp. PSOL-1 TaxID=1844999 RepID=UPI0013D064D5|nr:hypothetical protein [Listeria sp. PSOL-1]
MAEFVYALELRHPTFKTPEVVSADFDPASIFVSGVPFWQEQLFYTEASGVMPWKDNREQACRHLNKNMNVLLDEIYASLEKKEKPSSSTVRDALGIFISVLFWSNGRPVQLMDLWDQIETLVIQPLNLAERLAYVLERGDTFLGYSQLKELMLEQRKLIVKEHNKDV